MTNIVSKNNEILSFEVVLIEEVPVKGNAGVIAYDVTIVEKHSGNIVDTRTDRFVGNIKGTPGTVMSLIEGDDRAVAVTMPERFGDTFGLSWVEKFLA